MILSESDDEFGESELPTQSTATEDVTPAQPHQRSRQIRPSAPPCSSAPTPIAPAPPRQPTPPAAPAAPAEAIAPATAPTTAPTNNRSKAPAQKVASTTNKQTPLPRNIQDHSATSRNSLATMYAEKCKDKNDFRSQMIGSKEKWKQAELNAVAQNQELDRKHKLRVDNIEHKRQDKRAKPRLL
ncbi:unnamed protein product [Calypogeia fissa]